MLAHRLGAIEVMGSNPGKGEAFLNYLNLMLTKKVPILTHDVDVSLKLLPEWGIQGSLSPLLCTEPRLFNILSLSFCSTLALIAIPQPMASSLQTDGQGRASRRV